MYKRQPLGCVNVHGSLLPRYRGAAPIQWAVINGEKETGVTTMYMDEGVDTGDIILQSTTPIGPEETAGELFDRLAAQGAELLVETLRLVERGEAPRRAQEGESCYASMLDKELAELDFNAPAQAVHDLSLIHIYFIAKAACGLADDMLTTTFLAATCPKLVAPAMNVNMYENPATQQNIETLRRRGMLIDVYKRQPRGTGPR